MTEEQAMVLCHTVTKLPIPFVPAKIVRCAECRARVWLADSSPQDVKVVCVSCGVKLAKSEPGPHTVVITKRQAALGLNEEMAKAAFDVLKQNKSD
jgi:predicted RNA-binding Zn-ribbon protein involved in translation (DUF1610 family)